MFLTTKKASISPLTPSTTLTSAANSPGLPKTTTSTAAKVCEPDTSIRSVAAIERMQQQKRLVASEIPPTTASEAAACMDSSCGQGKKTMTVNHCSEKAAATAAATDSVETAAAALLTCVWSKQQKQPHEALPAVASTDTTSTTTSAPQQQSLTRTGTATTSLSSGTDSANTTCTPTAVPPPGLECAHQQQEQVSSNWSPTAVTGGGGGGEGTSSSLDQFPLAPDSQDSFPCYLANAVESSSSSRSGPQQLGILQQQMMARNAHPHQSPEHLDSNLSLSEYFCPEDDDDNNTNMTPSEADVSSIGRMNSREYLLDTPPSCLASTNGMDKSPPTQMLLLPPPAAFQGVGGGAGGRSSTIPWRAADNAGTSSNNNSNSTQKSKNTLLQSSQSRRQQPPQPVLYSAIGSLEDPSNGSFGWNNRAAQGKYKGATMTTSNKYDFPSSALLPPQNQLKRASTNSGAATTGGVTSLRTSQQKNLPRGSSSSTAATTKATNSMQKLKENLAQVNSTSEQDEQSQQRAASSTSRQEDETVMKTSSDVTLDQKQPATTSGAINKPKAPPSSLRNGSLLRSDDTDKDKKVKQNRVKIAPENQPGVFRKKTKKKNPNSRNKPVEMFRPCSDAYTPRMGKKEIKYKPAKERTRDVHQMASGMGTLSRPNFRDALRRVAMIIHQHIVKIEQRFESRQHGNPQQGSPSSPDINTRSTTVGSSTGKAAGGAGRLDDNLFAWSMKEVFSEEQYATPTYKCTMVRVPMARPGMVYGIKKVRQRLEIPTEQEIYDFAHRLFKTVQLSSECSIVCLIYVERLMEVAKVPLLASTWRPIVMCGLLLASKVWQDLSSWNIEFATVYPQYSLSRIHKLECQFLRMVKWDLYISSSLYAKYYFALRSIVEKPDFRQRYNRMVGGVDSVQVDEARKIEERSTLVKEEVLKMQLSRSM